MPHAVGDLSAGLLGQAGVQGAAHAPGFHRPQILDIDHRGPGRDGLVDGPPGSSPRKRVHRFEMTVRFTIWGHVTGSIGLPTEA
ncbi:MULTISPECIES: hypothetical protein [unclassified Streptomyces]|uniref:hypothetical protein n=1 Tax=unclassified Streptomyces TaxID=2593676 RepID=UPI003D8E657E